MTIKQFSIAASSNGTIGLITSQTKVEHKYHDSDKTVMVWTGVIIQDNSFMGRGESENEEIHAKIGGFWSSTNPILIAQPVPEEIFELLTQKQPE